MADPTLVDETFEDPIIEEQEVDIEPRSESDSLPDDEPGREPPVAQSQEPPAQAALHLPLWSRLPPYRNHRPNTMPPASVSASG